MSTKIEPEEGAPGEAGLRWALGRALSEAHGNTGDDGVVHVDPYDPDDIDPLVDAVIEVLASSHITQAARDVLAERQRQIEAEGWTPERDDRYTSCELAAAAATYATCTQANQLQICGVTVWPWPLHWWKPTSYRRNLVKACALILAEIERLDRAVDHKQGDAA